MNEGLKYCLELIRKKSEGNQKKDYGVDFRGDKNSYNNCALDSKIYRIFLSKQCHGSIDFLNFLNSYIDPDYN